MSTLDPRGPCFENCVAGDRVRAEGDLRGTWQEPTTVEQVLKGYMTGQRIVHLASGAIIFQSQRHRLAWAE